MMAGRANQGKAVVGLTPEHGIHHAQQTAGRQQRGLVRVFVDVGVGIQTAQAGRRLQTPDVAWRMHTQNRVHGDWSAVDAQHAVKNAVILQQRPRLLETPIVFRMAIEGVAQVKGS